MPSRIQIKRGSNSKISSLILQTGEPAFATDTGKLYIGNEFNKTLVNPIDKPAGIQTTSFFTNSQVNDYGQVVSQSSITQSDITAFPSSKVSGLGTLATVNTGVLSGQVPTLDALKKFPTSSMPVTFSMSSVTAIYENSSAVDVYPSTYVPFNKIYATGKEFTLNSDGTVRITNPGVYLFSYTITTSSSAITTVLYSSSGNYAGSMTSGSANGLNTFCMTNIMIAYQISSNLEQVGVRNVGNRFITIVPNQSSITILKIS